MTYWSWGVIVGDRSWLQEHGHLEEHGNMALYCGTQDQFQIGSFKHKSVKKNFLYVCSTLSIMQPFWISWQGKQGLSALEQITRKIRPRPCLSGYVTSKDLKIQALSWIAMESCSSLNRDTTVLLLTSCLQYVVLLFAAVHGVWQEPDSNQHPPRCRLWRLGTYILKES